MTKFTPLQVVKEWTFTLSRLVQLLGSAAALWLSAVAPTNNNWYLNGDMPWGLVGIPVRTYTWEWAAVAVSATNIAFRLIKILISLRYGRVGYLFMYTKFDQDRLHATISAVIDLLFCISFAILAGFASQPILGFHFLGDDCDADAHAFRAMAVNLTSEYNSTDTAFTPYDAATICNVFKAIPALLISLAVLFAVTAGLRPSVSNVKIDSLPEWLPPFR